MLNKMTEQFQKSVNPFNDLIVNNAKVFAQLAEQQTKLFSDIVNESVAFTKTLSTQKDIHGVVEAQEAFIGNVQDNFTSASEEASALFSEIQATASDAVKPFFSQDSDTKAAK